MSEHNEGPEGLRRLLEEMATEDAEALLEEARSGAYARARRALEDAIYEELLEAASKLRAAAAEHTNEVAAEPAASEPASVQPTAEATSALRTSDRLWWAYCVLSSVDADVAAADLDGIEAGTSVEVAAHDRLAVLVSPVPAVEFGDEQLRQHLEDLRWVERVARAHERVLEAAMERATLVPLRLCTLYHDLDGVRRLLAEHENAFAEALAAVEGCEEWGVKVFAGPDAGTHVPTGPAAANEPSEASGTAYLAGRRQERDAAQRAREIRAGCAEDVHLHARALARSAATNPPQRPEAHGRPDTMLLNGAYLVERARVGELHEAVRELTARWEPAGFAVELTGPWPPYNFVSGPTGVIP